MSKLPKELKLTQHARERLRERKDPNNTYNTKNLMRSPCKWYGKGDLIPNSKLYLHCLYVCRKSKNKLGYLTDGKIEVLYDKEFKTVITVLEVKEKFQPITQFVKPEILKEIKRKKELKKMGMKKREMGTCPDCGQTGVEITSQGVCVRCRVRRTNFKSRGKEYIPYVNLSEEEKRKVDTLQLAMRDVAERKKVDESNNNEVKEIPIPKIPIIENYYQVKAEQNPAIAQVIEKPQEPERPIETVATITPKIDPLSDSMSFINTLRGCGCEIPEDTLKEVLEILMSTDKLKDILMAVAKNESQQAILDLEQALNVVERKLQHDWEYNGFQEVDDIKFKGFLTWRRVLKGAIFFWKKLYQTNTIVEMQKVWASYTADPNQKVLMSGDRIDSVHKRYQITTESISTIYNTRRPFTRVFYAESKEAAYNLFVKWMAERQLHEDKRKTTIVELKSEGVDGRQ